MKKLGRIDELDLLRGFFILVIIVDHLQRWPSPYTYITGEGRLWVSAAEGFFIISGLLIGYLRGFKQRTEPLKALTGKLWHRAGILYIWTVVITFFVVAMTVILPVDPNAVPRLPDADQVASLPVYLWNVFSMNFATDLIYFLRLYTIMLLATPIFLWLLRTGRWYIGLLISTLLYAGSFLLETPEGAMQWQFLFFVPALVGYKLQPIIHWFRTHARATRTLMAGAIILTLTSMVLSYFWVLGWDLVESPHSSLSRDTYVATRSWLDLWFTKSPLAVGRVALAFIWFAGLVSLFHLLLPHIKRWFGWLLSTFGTQSLSAYCLQAIIIIFAQTWLPFSVNSSLNLIITTFFVVICWGLLKIPLIQKILPR